MTKRFEAFKAALEALCNEHGIEINHGEWCIYTSDINGESEPFSFSEYELRDETKPQPEDGELYEEMLLSEAERAARYQAEHAAWAEKFRAEEAARIAAIYASEPFKSKYEKAMAQAALERKLQMRISTDPQDPAFIDERPRRVWVNDVEVLGWTVADEFRRCAITPKGVVNGAVRIERLPDDAAEVAPEPVESNNNLCGMFVAVPKVAPEPEPVVEVAPPSFAVPTVQVKAKSVAKKAPMPAPKKSKRVR